MKPFLLLATREDENAASGEVAAFRKFGGLGEYELQVRRLERAELGAFHLEDYSGIILGGSPFNVSDEVKPPLQQRVEADLARVVQAVLQADFPFFGACFGVGVLGVALGGVVDRSCPEEPTAVPITLTADGRQDRLLAGLPAAFPAVVGHKEALVTMPERAHLLATGQACPIQMFRVGAHVYATQFHPELDADGLAARLRVYAHSGYCEPDQAEALIAQARSAGLGAVHEVLRNFVQYYRR